MKQEKISELTTNRLSIYLRCLEELAAEGFTKISSDKLAQRFQLHPAQIRKDLANFGEFGVRGVGYSIKDLTEHLRAILGIDKQHQVAIIGAGRLGTVLADYYGFKRTNFSVTAIFDTDRQKIGKEINGIKIYDLKNFAEIAKRDKIDLTVIAVPHEFAQEVLEIITKAGIKAVLNFAPTPLRVAEDVKLKTVDFTITLEGLAYFLSQKAISNGNI